ncbi:hypothetical protein MFUL124B02_11860 [Myxococcus fulvus 124B02]|nr:hypothetical protein MFUL124B02_11860 [Myxococcus fulvus 124B02]
MSQQTVLTLSLGKKCWHSLFFVFWMAPSGRHLMSRQKRVHSSSASQGMTTSAMPRGYS